MIHVTEKYKSKTEQYIYYQLHFLVEVTDCELTGRGGCSDAEKHNNLSLLRSVLLSLKRMHWTEQGKRKIILRKLMLSSCR